MKEALSTFKYEDITYYYNDLKSHFETNYVKDLQLMIVWSKARGEEKRILKELSVSFNVLNVSEHSWSQAKIDDNFHRIYDVAPTGGGAGKKSEVGGGKFLVIVLQDLNPSYHYRSDASGNVKIVNSNVVDRKKLFRDWVGGQYMVHSTDSIKEFFNNGLLLFGHKYFFDLLEKKQWDNAVDVINDDLLGAEGWADPKELFKTLNLTTEYVILRGADTIESNINSLEGDVDILCANLNEFTAVANAERLWNSKNFYHVSIKGKKVLFDIRSCGDSYFDNKWQDQIIKNRVINEANIYVPRVDDYFFSHLYHAYIHKPYFLDKYTDRLTALAEKLGIEKLSFNSQQEGKPALELLRGFLVFNKYSIAIPNDDSVYINIKVASKLQNINRVFLYYRRLLVKIKNFPSKYIMKIKHLIKKNQRLFNLLSGIKNHIRHSRKSNQS